MPKINVESSYFNHPKTKRLINRCGKTADIYPIRLWCFCAEFFPKDGVLKGYSGSEIEAMIGWDGPTGNLVFALEQVGFLDSKMVSLGIDGVGLQEKEFRIHDWSIHAGFIWDYKMAGKEGAKRRWKSNKIIKSYPNSPPNSHPIKDPNAIELNGIELNKDIKTCSFSFEEIWNSYPKKVGKKQALRFFKASVNSPADFERIQKALKNYVATDTVRKGFIQNASTWFNNWEDWVDYKGDSNANQRPTSDLDRLLDREIRKNDEKPRMGQVPSMFGGVDET